MANVFTPGTDTGLNLRNLLMTTSPGVSGGATPMTTAAKAGIRKQGQKTRDRLRSSFADRGLSGAGVRAAAEAELGAEEALGIANVEAAGVDKATNQVLKILGMQTQREQFDKQMEAQEGGFGDILGSILGTVGGPVIGKAGQKLASAIF